MMSTMFFFSSRRRHTRSLRDWSSDVCFFRSAVELGRQQPVQTFGLGLLALCAVPLAAVLIGITLVGIPLAFAVAALYWLGLMLAWPALGLVVGTEVARWVRRT